MKLAVTRSTGSIGSTCLGRNGPDLDTDAGVTRRVADDLGAPEAPAALASAGQADVAQAGAAGPPVVPFEGNGV